MGTGMRGQGATEYLVLLAVVLVIALVGIALLGFFPGTANDAQIAESQIYWRSASPVAIVEWDAKPYFFNSTLTGAYLRIRNTGTYQLAITKLVAGSNSIAQMPNSSGIYLPINNYLTLAPGEEEIIAYPPYFSGVPANSPFFWFCTSGCTGVHNLNGASSICSNGSSWGQLVVPNFGFEYIQYVEGQQIVKRQVGAKPLTIKCSG